MSSGDNRLTPIDLDPATKCGATTLIRRMVMRSSPLIVPVIPEDYYIACTAQRSQRPIFTAQITDHHQRPDERTALRPAARGDVQPRHQPIRGRVACHRAGNIARLGLEGRDVPSKLEDFIECHVGPDRQPTLRLALK
jgi:hypothetical protein